MAKRKRRTRNLSLQDYDNAIQRLNIQKHIQIEKALKSNNPNDILKAKKALENQYLDKQTKAFVFDPFSSFNDARGYKSKSHYVSFEVLKMVRNIPIIKSVHNTRIFQVQKFLKFTTDLQKEGFTIRRKQSRFQELNKEISDEDKRTIDYIVDFLENSRKPEQKSNSLINFNPAQWDDFEDFDDYVRLILNDSYTFDQIAVENVRSRRFELLAYKPIDASTIRLLNTIDKNYQENQFDEINGFLPRYGQVWREELQKDKNGNPIVFYPWELQFGIRNKSTDVNLNNYGTSELEVLVDTITYFLNGYQLNGNYIKNGSNPKGFLSIKGNITNDKLLEFRQYWRHAVQGAGNEHKIPALGGEGLDVDFIKLQDSNKDMEFLQWLEFLMINICAVYTIDPSELGYNFKNSQQVFGQDGQKQRLKHSTEKGLKPILIFLQKFITKNVVCQLHPDFEFVFTGVDIEDETTMLDNDVKKIQNGLMSLEDGFEKYSSRKFDPKKDTILNNVYLQSQQLNHYGGEAMNKAVDEMCGGEDIGVANPLNGYEKASKTNPIVKEAFGYIEKNFNY